mgnify:CR=1 FL=1
MPRCRLGHGHSGAIGRHRAARSIAFLLLTGLFCSPVGVAAQAQPSLLTPRILHDAYADHVAEASRRFGIPEFWIDAVLQAESAGDHRAISSAGAMGLMQIMPETGAQLANELGWPENYSIDDLNRPHVSMIFGAHYLRQQLNLFGGDVFAMLAAYNGGPGNTIAWKSLTESTDPDLFLEIVRIEETRNYIRLINEIHYIYRWLYGELEER